MVEAPLSELEKNHQFGLAAGHLHKAMMNFESKHERKIIDINFILCDPFKRLKQYLGDIHRNKISRIMNKTLLALDKLDNSSLTKGVLHGDLVHWNAHISNNKKISFFDFDFAGPGWLVYDLCQFIHESIYMGSSPKSIDTFLKTYRTIIDLSEEDLELLNVLLPLRGIWFLS